MNYCKCAPFALCSIPEMVQEHKAEITSIISTTTISNESLGCSCSKPSDDSILVEHIQKQSTIKPLLMEDPKSPKLMLNTNFRCIELNLKEFSFEKIAQYFHKNWDNITKLIGFSLLKDVLEFCTGENYNHKKSLALLEIFYFALKYFINSKISNRTDLTIFFQEQILRYAVNHPPKSLEIFSIDESFNHLKLYKNTLFLHTELLRAVTAKNDIVYLDIIEYTPPKAKKK